MKMINKIVLAIGVILVIAGLIMFMYDVKYNERIYMIIIGLILIGINIVSLVIGTSLSTNNNRKRIIEFKNDDDQKN